MNTYRNAMTRSGVAILLAGAALLGSTAKAEAALVINFDQAVLDGGNVSASGGGNAIGTGIVFTSILLQEDSTNPSTNLRGVQCGPALTSATATAANACQLNFNTAANMFQVTALGGLFDIGPDFQAFTADRGAQVAAPGNLVVNGTFSFFNLSSGFFIASGNDRKSAELLTFFGISPNATFNFMNTEILFASSTGNVDEADLTNRLAVPEPGLLALFGIGLAAVTRGLKRRRSA